MAGDVACASWSKFEEHLERYIKLPRLGRQQFIFRGQADARWALAPTLDRGMTHFNGDTRDQTLARLISEFQRQSLGVDFPLGIPESQRQWELLGRHHGLPSAILDWTTSPYVAAFFAFADPGVPDTESVAVWAFSRKYLTDPKMPGTAASGGEDVIELWDDIDDFRFNLRAVVQESVFMKVHFEALPLEGALGPHLTRFSIPANERLHVLGKLHEMRITHRHLFRDLDYAAKTAKWLITEAR